MGVRYESKVIISTNTSNDVSHLAIEQNKESASNLDSLSFISVVRMISQSKKYIDSSMGPKFAEPPLLDKEMLFEESRNTTPMLCLLSQVKTNLLDESAPLYKRARP